MDTEHDRDIIWYTSHPREWVYRRMTAQSPGVRGPAAGTAGGGPITPESYKLDFVERVVLPSAWRQARPPEPKKDPCHPWFKRVDEQSLVVSNEAQCDDWLNASARSTAALFSSARPTHFDVTEHDHWMKHTVQKGRVPYWFMTQLGPGSRDVPALSQNAWRALRLLESAYRYASSKAESADAYADANPEPANTNPGWPTFSGGWPGKLLSGLFSSAAASFDEVESLAQDFTHLVGLPEATILAYGLAGRSGPLYKWTSRLQFDPSKKQWHTRSEWRGHCQRNRVVQMSPACFNGTLRRLTATLKLARKQLPGLWRTGNQDARLVSGFPYNYEADISGYDISVLAALQEIVAASWKRMWPHLTAEIDFWIACERRPLIVPDWELDRERCSVAGSHGGTRSGLKPTAEIGTFIGAWATLTALLDQGLNLQNWPVAHDVISLHQGDDVRVAVHRPLNADQWAESFLGFGLRCALINGDGFLARHTIDGRTVPIAGRLVQQTLSNEHEPRGRSARGILYIGALARFQGWDQLPSHYQAAVWSNIQHASWIQQSGAKSISALMDFLVTPEAKAEMKKALEMAQGEAWLATEARYADRNATAQTVIDVARDLGLRPEATASLDMTVDRLIKGVQQLPRAEKLQLASEGWHGINSGPSAANLWARRVADRIRVYLPNIENVELPADEEDDAA